MWWHGSSSSKPMLGLIYLTLPTALGTTIDIPIFQMEQPRHREAKQLPQVAELGA